MKNTNLINKISHKIVTRKLLYETYILSSSLKVIDSIPITMSNFITELGPDSVIFYGRNTFQFSKYKMVVAEWGSDSGHIVEWSDSVKNKSFPIQLILK